MPKQNKKVDQIRQLYHLADSSTRRQWQQINQKGYEFAHDDTIDALAYACKYAHPPTGLQESRDGWTKNKPKARNWITA